LASFLKEQPVTEQTSAHHGADHALATYGTLAPGRPNAHLLADIDGQWTQGVVRGRLIENGWGAAMGYPGIVLDDMAGEVAVHLFTSPALVDAWPRLDAFEGEGYRRVPVRVQTDLGTIWASIYALAQG
jgi:gamma-glutamylcyclotransferase (GGCT)/AIG2-like uncharacterized protein YtfP